jgi:acyl-coenzyme A thioesterase PaaI-like protein
MADAELAERTELAAQVRRLLHTLVRTGAGAADLRAATSQVSATADLLGAAPPLRLVPDTPFHPNSLVGGTSHPIAPQLKLEPADGAVSGTVRLGPAYEGGPGLVHGGVLALMFDHAMGVAVFLDGHGAMTRSLDVRYVAPTPLDTELRVTARIDRTDGRSVHVVAEITAADVVTATAHATFVRLTEANVRRIFARNSGEFAV